MITWVIGKWYMTRRGDAGVCDQTDGNPQPIGVMFNIHRNYCVGGEFWPGFESCNDIIAGPFDTEAEAAKQSEEVEVWVSVGDKKVRLRHGGRILVDGKYVCGVDDLFDLGFHVQEVRDSVVTLHIGVVAIECGTKRPLSEAIDHYREE